MAIPSESPPASWSKLAANARDAPPPVLDMQPAIRAQIASDPSRMVESASAALIDDLVSLFQFRWLQAGLGVLAFVASLSCRKGFDAVEEIAFIWELHAPTLFGI